RVVLNYDDVAVTLLPAAESDAPIAGRMDRRAHRRREIHALMRAHRAENRVQARARKTRGDMAELDGHAQELLARGTSVLGIEESLALAVRKPERRVA